MTTPRSTPPVEAPTRRIASFHTATAGYWPGHVAAVLELWGCSFTCPRCHGLRSPTAATDAPEWDDILTHIATNRRMLHGIVVTGGEPLEDPDLPSLLAALAESGLAICLETNGSRPDVLSFLLAEALVDFVVLDVKTVPARYCEISRERDMPARVAECVDMLIRSGIAHEFRTALDPAIVDVEDLTSIARALRGGRLYAVQCRAPGTDDVRAALDGRAVLAAAVECERFLPTIVRGFDAGED
jgi:pyruvate formate lyase activating enzyme